MNTRVFLLCLLVACADAAPVPLVEVTRAAAVRYCSRWRLTNGTIIETPLTRGQFQALTVKNARGPARPAEVPSDAVWICSAGGVPTWTTADGKMPLGGFEVRTGGAIYLGTGALDPITVRGTRGELVAAEKTFIVRGESFRLNRGTLEKL